MRSGRFLGPDPHEEDERERRKNPRHAPRWRSVTADNSAHGCVGEQAEQSHRNGGDLGSRQAPSVEEQQNHRPEKLK